MRKQHAAAAALFIVLAIVMTWPLAPRLDHVAADPSDPFINMWILDWDHYATFHQPLHLFDANIFFPAHDTLALSENLYGLALLLMPFRAIGMGPVTVYNLAMLAGFAFSGFAAYLLGFRLTGSFIGGIAGGLFHAFVPFRFTHLPHVQHVVAGWVPLLLLALLAYLDRPSWRTGLLFAIVFLMNGLTNIHWLLFGSFAVGATMVLFAANGVRRWRELLVCTAIAGALLAAFLAPYWRIAETPGLARGWEETKSYSATWSDWLVASDYSRIYAGLKDDRVYAERKLFPGVLSLVAAAAALLLARRYPRGVSIGLLWIVIGVLGSLGLNGFFHSFLFDAVPGFRGIRVPARWAEIAYVGLSMLIAVVVAFVARRARWLAAVIPLLFLIELYAAPIRWFRVPLEVPDVYRWLATQRVRAIAELPIDNAGSEYVYVFRSMAHHKNMVNGASGAVPAQFARFSGMWKSTPIPDEFGDELLRAGVDLVIVHADTLPPHDATTIAWLKREMDRGRMSFVRRFRGGVGGDWVFRVGPGLSRSGPAGEPALRAFLSGQPVYNPFTFGFFDPPPGFVRGPRFFSGYAFSPYGIRKIEFLFHDGRVRVPAILVTDDRLVRRFPPYPRTPKPRFVLSMPKRPDGVPVDTDVQAIVTDGRGEQLRLQFYWITWE
ncbi:MAG TPA: hypothetical protein VLV78_06265 [Thermoanaerobaculia bacterium]|nr:hypothetical protein [Thermoanaerobaculia bacterium]